MFWQLSFNRSENVVELGRPQECSYSPSNLRSASIVFLTAHTVVEQNTKEKVRESFPPYTS